MNNFRYCISLANTLYEIEGNEEDLIELALVGFRLIGNRRDRLYKTVESVIDGSVNLPCNCENIEAVVYIGSEEPNYVGQNGSDLSKLSIEDYIESYKILTHPYYTSGKFVKYTRTGDVLNVDSPNGLVLILYKGSVTDEDGLPLITDKEALALADYIAYYEKFKQGIRNNDQNALTISLTIKQSWLMHCDAARTPDHISQNTIDEAANAATSWNRKVYNRSYKPLL